MPLSFEIIRFPAASSSSSMNFEARPNIFLSRVTLTTSSALAARRSQFSGTLIACAPAVITLARTNIADGSANFSFIDPSYTYVPSVSLNVGTTAVLGSGPVESWYLRSAMRPRPAVWLLGLRPPADVVRTLRRQLQSPDTSHRPQPSPASESVFRLRSFLDPSQKAQGKLFAGILTAK